jgi:hypothetical protein
MQVSSFNTILSVLATSGAGAKSGTPISYENTEKSTVAVTVTGNTGSQVVLVKGSVSGSAAADFGTLETLTFDASTGAATQFSQVTSPFDYVTADIAAKGSSASVILATARTAGSAGY